MISREDEIDIAVDLKGYTRNSRPKIFAYRAAPIQINFLGYPGTIGSHFMDYIIADIIIIPHNKRKSFSEKKIYLDQLVYWNVELQEPYFSYKEAFLKYESLLKNK